MKMKTTLAIAVGLSVAILSGCDAVGTNDPTSVPEVNSAPQYEISREIPMDVKTLPTDGPRIFASEGDTTGRE